MVTEDKRIQSIDKLLSEANRIPGIPNLYSEKPIYVASIPFLTWLTKVSQFLLDNCNNQNAYLAMFNDCVLNEVDREQPRYYHLSLVCSILLNLKEYLIENPENLKKSKIESIDQIELLCNKFHTVAKQLRSRRENRPTLIIEDEYDVQDLLYALLRINFADIRTEEWTPSYAGGSSRMDFLLKNEKTVIEVKKTRESLKEKNLGEQLLVDIAKYEQHPDCNTLICFIYDPEERIENHAGLEKDLMDKSTEKLKVVVFIRPTGN